MDAAAPGIDSRVLGLDSNAPDVDVASSVEAADIVLAEDAGNGPVEDVAAPCQDAGDMSPEDGVDWQKNYMDRGTLVLDGTAENFVVDDEKVLLEVSSVGVGE